MPSIVYTPSSEPVTYLTDGLVWAAANTISNAVGNAGAVRRMGCGRLGELMTGGELFIVGHGNSGGKIGAHHHEAAGAETLVAQLGLEGLPKSPRETITIHLYACATGTSVRTKYAFWRKEPYASRFAKYLAKSGFNDINVVGYVGFMNMGGSHSLNYHYQKADQRHWTGGRAGRRPWEDAPTVTYRVNAGASAKVGGDEWLQYTSITVHGRGRKNSYVLSIREKT